MKFIPESFMDITRLVSLYHNRIISAEEYYQACDIWASLVVEQELKERK